MPSSASPTLRTKTRTFVLAGLIIMGSLTLWLVPMVAFGVSNAAMTAEIVVVLLLGLGLIFAAYSKNLAVSVHVFNTLGYIGGLGVQTALGGLQASGYVGIWFILVPIMTSATLSRRAAQVWLGIFILATIGVVLTDAEVARHISPPPPLFQFVNSVGNITVVSTIIISVNLYLISQLDDARERADNLLLNILPLPIAERLKQKTQVIADRFEAVSVLFADIVGFTPLSAELDPVEMVNLLNEVFSYFDILVAKYGLEKIRTIGDNYMVASGVPTPRADHANALANLALEMLAHCEQLKDEGTALQFRIGINSGPLIAGIIGRKKFQYDIYGDTVNIASRMESHGQPGKIQITKKTFELLKDEFVCEPRGTIEIKGKGQMQTWFLTGRKV